MMDQVVHLPAKSKGSWVGQQLAAASGAVVQLALGGEQEVQP
jgi:hypothetical protein